MFASPLFMSAPALSRAATIVKLLLRSGAKLEALDQEGHTAYDYAKNLVPDEIYGSDKQDWLRNVLGDALDFFEGRRRVLKGRVQLLVLRKLVEKGRAAPVPRGSAELKITRIFGTRSMPDDIFSKVLAFWHPPGSPRPRRYRSWSQHLPLTP